MSMFEYSGCDLEFTNIVAERYGLFDEDTIEAIKTCKTSAIRSSILLEMEDSEKLAHHNLMGYEGDPEFQDLHRAALEMLINMYGINLRAGLTPELAFNIAYEASWDNLETANFYCEKWIKREEA